MRLFLLSSSSGIPLCTFAISDGIMAQFFITTGLHGFHVIIGTLLLLMDFATS